MPKMKSNKSATKRFKLRKSGSIKRGSAFRSHILTKMSNKRKRNLRNSHSIHEADAKNVKKMMCV